MTSVVHSNAQPRRRGWRPWIVTLLLLAGIGVDRALLGRASTDSDAYHARVREAAAVLPFSFGNWLGVDVPQPEDAIDLLKPNVIISRRYQDILTGRQATLLLVHCRDARDILGHFPPYCYVGQGWVLASSSPHDWQVAGRQYRGMQYRFRSGAANSSNELAIDNFMLLPNERTARDMDEVDRAARDSTLKHFGAGQVQIVYDAQLPESDRQEMFELFIQESQPVIDMIMKPVVEK